MCMCEFLVWRDLQQTPLYTQVSFTPAVADGDSKDTTIKYGFTSCFHRQAANYLQVPAAACCEVPPGARHPSHFSQALHCPSFPLLSSDRCPLCQSSLRWNRSECMYVSDLLRDPSSPSLSCWDRVPVGKKQQKKKTTCFKQSERFLQMVAGRLSFNLTLPLLTLSFISVQHCWSQCDNDKERCLYSHIGIHFYI